MLNKKQLFSMFKLKQIIVEQPKPTESLKKPVTIVDGKKTLVKPKKVYDEKQIKAITNQLVSHIKQEEKRQLKVQEIKENRVSDEVFKTLLESIEFSLKNPDRFPVLC
jgi:hypothetical protein